MVINMEHGLQNGQVVRMRIQLSGSSLWRNYCCPGLIALFCFFSAPVFGQQARMMTVTIKEGQNLRGIAAQYLGDANLWTEILRVNNLETVTDIKPGMKVKIPSNSV